MRGTGLAGAAALVLLTAGLAGCGGGGGVDDGPSSVVTTPNPEDPTFAVIARTARNGTTWHIVPVPASGASGLTAQSPGATQIGTVAGQGSSSFRWTGRRSVALCADNRQVQMQPQATVNGQSFTVAQSCTPAMAVNGAPNPSAVSPFGVPPAAPAGPTPPQGSMPAQPAYPPMTGPGAGGAPGGLPANPYGQTPGGYGAAPPVSPASNLPARRPGLWRTTIRNQQGQTQSQDTCLTPERASNWTPDTAEAQACSHYRVRREGEVVIGEAVCNTPNGQMMMQARMMGDWNSAYQGQMIVQVQTPQGPITQQVQTYSQYVGPCQTN